MAKKTTYPVMQVYDNKESAALANRFVRGEIYPLSAFKKDSMRAERKINPEGFVIIPYLPSWVIE